jgi:3',5'-cyclic AMP phosphodiesterase CpdA
MHRIRVTGLAPGTTYNYTVNQGAEVYTSHFKTSPTEDSSVRFIVYGDTETTPSANGHFVNWAQPFGNPNRTYVAEQTEGLRQNNNIIESRNPDFLGIAGDIVDAGGEQRDWDELWRHMAGSINDLGSSIPILGTPGNHDDYGGVAGGYSDAGSIIARNKFSTYFESPDNGSSVPEFKDRYFRLDYGPITFISIDVSNGSANGTSSDTNWLLGAGPNYPDFNPGSIQYQWLEAQLADAQATSRFTFVELHRDGFRQPVRPASARTHSTLCPVRRRCGLWWP